MKKFISNLFLLTSSFLLSSCGAEQEFTSWPCRFIYDNSIHLDQTLATATNSASSGIFCKITQTVKGGTKYLVFENNQGLSSTQIETATEIRSNLRLGLNNGIIVGFQNFGGFVAYDIQCINCVYKENNFSNPNYRLTMDQKGTGIATCSKCGKQYDLNNGGLIVNGEQGDRSLQPYRNAQTSGPQGVTTVLSE
jgi:uncharacterized Zn-finger protein